jgi:hypothetical protein
MSSMLIGIALQAVYPEQEWKIYDRFTFGHTGERFGSKSQRYLLDTLRSLFDNTIVLANYRLPREDILIGGAKGLKFYEFDVSILYLIS